MKNDFVKFSNGEYAYTDEFGKINLIKCDRGEDFVYILLCKEDNLERLECENRICMNTISKIRKNECNRKRWNMNYIILVPFAMFIFFSLKPISLSLGLISSLGLLSGYKLSANLVCGRKKDNKIKLEYTKRKYNENREKIYALRDEIKRLKMESNFTIIDRSGVNSEKKYSYEFRGNSLVNNDDNIKIVHKVRILSDKK